ncbi:MAG: tellurite resistance TerB family protein [Planctomycetota bacterium]|jgi:hypothetical protein
MPEVLILILVLIPVVVAIVVFSGLPGCFGFTRLINRLKFFLLGGSFKSLASQKADSHPIARCFERPDMDALNSRVRPTKQDQTGSVFDTLVVEICGSICAPGDGHYGVVQISLTDVTDQTTEAKPVHSSTGQWQRADSPVFCYNGDIGRLPEGLAKLSDWTAVAQLSLDWLVFPHKGRRELQLSISVFSRDDGEELACAQCDFSYENPKFGYLDLQENIQRTKTLAVTLAFSVSAADDKLFDCEVELIKNWAKGNIDKSQVCDRTRRKLEKALNKTVSFFRGGNQVDVYEICREITEIAPVAHRYEILELCLQVAGANGTVAVKELAVLKDLANRLEVDTDSFRDMVEKILPADMHKIEDAEVLIGVTSDMNKEQTRQHLNKEYRKWNARATNSDPQIQNQADYMLKFIAQARSQCVG